ncbi:MAG: hypothetical protein U1F36_03630 [Planctomycetota bacterium]
MRIRTRVLAVGSLLALSIPAALHAQGTPIGFEEEFALAPDRAAMLARLIPGTEEHFFYSCLLAQHERRPDEVPPLLRAWIEKHGRTARVQEIENRQALLDWTRAPSSTVQLLRDRLGLGFSDQRETHGVPPDLPVRLDARLIDLETLTRNALDRHSNTVDGFEDAALRSLATRNLSDEQLVSLLSRVQVPDLPNLVELVARELRRKDSRGFGAFTIHARMTLDQLDALAAQMPGLINAQPFVDACLRRLAPDADVDVERDASARDAWITRLQTFAARLGTAHNPLKSFVLQHRLAFDLTRGKVDTDVLLAWLRLPRQASWVNQDWLRRQQRAGEVFVAEQGTGYGLPATESGTDLLRSCLEKLFVDAGSFDVYAEYVDRAWLSRVFAETKILSGIGDMQQWYAMIGSPAYYEQLRDRVEIAFPRTAKTEFGLGDKVALDVDVKNVKTLIVKVFEIDTFNYLRATGREVDASIDLDGLVATEERTETYPDEPLRRVRRSFEFPGLDHAGVWIVEMIGNGTSSRAVIRKGSLRYVEHAGAAGQVLRVLDGEGKLAPDASVLFAGREYRADERGEIVIPYSTAPATKPLILRRGEFATRTTLDHRGEDYALDLGVFVERESLLPGGKAKLLLRPTLRVGDTRVALSVLEEPVLTVTAADLDGSVSSSDVRGLTFSADAETVHEIQVPERVAKLSVTLRGHVRSLSQAKDVDLASASRSFELNGIDVTAATSCPLLGRNADGYVIDLLGKDGEPKADRALHLGLKHELFRDQVQVTLKTDAKGRITLGALPGIESIEIDGFPQGGATFVLDDRARTLPAALQGAAGATLRMPWPGRATALDASLATLLETRAGDGVYLRDVSDHLALQDGFLELRKLAAGDYLLVIEGSRFVPVRVSGGARVADLLVGRDRILEAADGAALQVTGLDVDDKELRVALANASASTRVHLFVTRWLPANDPYAALLAPGMPSPESVLTSFLPSSYHVGRAIGDEYRYILERRFTTHFPGNMLGRPGLLLNPWAIDEWNTAIGTGGGAGGKFGGRGGGRRQSGAGGPGPVTGSATEGGAVADLAFLPHPAVVLANLRPGKDGTVRIPRGDLGDGQLVHVVALDDESTVYRSVALQEKPLTPSPQHLRRALDPEKDFAQVRRIDFVDAGGSAVVADVRTADLQTFDTLADVHRLFRAISGNSDLDEFAFVLKWPDLKPEEKLEQYARHACHELHFFLFMKDRAFFDQVVKPYLANKAEKTFLDDWLLGGDLAGYLEPWAFARLNVFEKILLTQRLGGERDGITRLIRDENDLVPVDPTRLEALFGRAMQSGALETEGKLAAAYKQLQADEKARGDAGRPEAPVAGGRLAPSPAGPATAGPGGPPAARRAAPNKEKAAADEPAPAEAEVVEELAKDRDKADDARMEDQQRDAERRKNARELYRAPDVTRRFAESNYWHRRIQEQDAGLIRANAFWNDWAVALGRGGRFVSTHVAEATGSFAEMLLALAVLDLPFVAGEHETVVDGASFTLRAKTPLLAVLREIAPAAPAPRDGSPILVSQNFFRADERYRFEGSERRDAWVTDEFVVDVVYGCQVVITNPTSSPRTLDALLQIPQGALPVQGSKATRGLPVQLQPYGTQALEYSFYFPAAGDAVHYPVHVAADGVAVASAKAVTLHVVAQPTKVDTTSWEHLSQDGSADEVLRYVDSANLLRTDLSKIAWRMRDRDFFTVALAHLRKRHVYDDRLWAYSVFHRDAVAMGEYLRHQDGFLGTCGRYLASPLFTIDPVERRSYEHVEFDPLFNARAHRFGSERRILNEGLARQYLELMGILCYRPKLDDGDWLQVTYYLALQDRVEEALAAFARVDAAKVPTRLQYDALRAYLDFYTANTADARTIAERYADHPVERWRKWFHEVVAQLDEIEGKAVAGAGTDERTRRQTELAESEPSLEFALEGNRGVLHHRNLERCEVRYFAMDVEFLFSTHPFVQQGSDAFAFVRPNRRDMLTLDPKKAETSFDLPPEFAGTNVLIEVAAAGITRREAHYAHSLDVRWMEGYGQLQVTDNATQKPLSKVYVKVFARAPGGAVRFHKDGYTDLRGRFDYASVSGNANDVERFAVLVLSDDHGAQIRELAPPAR